jgi:hypothetical protein
MTTISELTAAQPVSGHRYPPQAAPGVEAYLTHLDALAGAETRLEAAAHLQSMAAAAGQVAAALAGTPEAAPDTVRDPLAWTDLATYLIRLAQALHFGERMDFSVEFGSEGWDDLAGAAVTRTGFAAAWQPMREDLLELAGLSAQDSDPPLRAFTVVQVIRAAAAVTDASW